MKKKIPHFGRGGGGEWVAELITSDPVPPFLPSISELPLIFTLNGMAASESCYVDVDSDTLNEFPTKLVCDFFFSRHYPEGASGLLRSQLWCLEAWVLYLDAIPRGDGEIAFLPGPSVVLNIPEGSQGLWAQPAPLSAQCAPFLSHSGPDWGSKSAVLGQWSESVMRVFSDLIVGSFTWKTPPHPLGKGWWGLWMRAQTKNHRWCVPAVSGLPLRLCRLRTCPRPWFMSFCSHEGSKDQPGPCFSPVCPYIQSVSCSFLTRPTVQPPNQPLRVSWFCYIICSANT